MCARNFLQNLLLLSSVDLTICDNSSVHQCSPKDAHLFYGHRQKVVYHIEFLHGHQGGGGGGSSSTAPLLLFGESSMLSSDGVGDESSDSDGSSHSKWPRHGDDVRDELFV